MIASLPMYDWPELVSGHDDLWLKIRQQFNHAGIETPKALSRTEGDETDWLNDELILGQTCGYPFATSLRDKVQYVATPCYAIKGCSGANYSSAIIVRRDTDFSMKNLPAAHFAFNSMCSLSGYRVIKSLLGEPESYFSQVTQTGSHRASAQLVVNGVCDVASLDAVCWHYLQMVEPKTADKLKVIGWTASLPGLPLITSLQTSQSTIEAMRAALKDIKLESVLAMAGFEVLEVGKYDALSAL